MMRLQRTIAWLGITVIGFVSAKNIVVYHRSIVITFDVTDKFIWIAGRNHASGLIVSIVDTIINEE